MRNGESALPELVELHAILGELGDAGRVELLTEVSTDEAVYPVHGIVLGCEDRTAPTFALVGGVHGLERIGTQVVLAYLTTVVRLLVWDDLFRTSLEQMRMVFVPLVNPGGMALGRRSNPAGVDLMRNAPRHPGAFGSLLVGGQRITPRLPWFAGSRDQMEPEAVALCEFIRREVFPARASLAIDVHSGFGLIDRLWFPYARTRRPFPGLAEIYKLTGLIDETLPNHVYRIEPQSGVYTIIGDLWDHLHDQHSIAFRNNTFVPLTLEMGSWAWLRKNPRQALSILGSFNPIAPHRVRRTLRRHIPLFDLMRRAAGAPAAWCVDDEDERSDLEGRAFNRWYSG